MASNVAAPKNTGGGGFVFEDEVCAWFLACMLAAHPVFDAELGAAVRIDFQTRPDGWFLDDVLLTTAGGATKHRLAISIKSNAQFTASAAPADFVACAWEQWLKLGSAIFDAKQDFMGLATAPLSGAATSSVSGLSEKVRVADADTFPTRLATPNWASEDERNLFTTFRCPSTLNGGATATDIDAARLLQRLRFVQYDFGAVTSESLKWALRLCQSSVSSASTEDASVLWNLLRAIAAEFRPRAGSIGLRDLVERLRGRVALADYPDHAADWAALEARSEREAAAATDLIAGRVRIPRDASVDILANALTDADLIALLGSSGGGKSAVAKALFARRMQRNERTLWLDARSLDGLDFAAFESAFRLQHSLTDLLGTATSATPVFVLDGLDRLYSENAFRNVAVLLRLARDKAPRTRWRIVAPCQSQEWPRVLDAIQRAGIGNETWTQVQLAPLKPRDLKPVSDALPALGRLLLAPKVGALLTNLKLLDLVARRIDAGTDIDPSTWVGESSVAEWFWTAEIDRGADRIQRGRFARLLAQRQADELVASVPIDDFSASELGPAESLAADQLCLQVPGDRIAFAHDLYGDWARLRILLKNRADLPAFLRGRRESPLWHRALRLLGIHLLEHGGGLEDWRALLASFPPEEFGVIRDVVLEAPIFAVNARDLLNAVLPDLLADGGTLLRRLLTRFLAFGTVPDPEMLALAASLKFDASVVRAAHRIPYWPYWLDVLAFIHAHRVTALELAPCEVARVIEMWMKFAPKGAALRAESAEVGILLGRHALDTREVYGGRDWESERERFYRCALAAAHERPEEVALIALTAAERRGTSTATKEKPSRRRRRGRSVLGGTGKMSEPWPDGPGARVEEEFRNVVLDSAAIIDLYRTQPSVAREVVLATLIEEPREIGWGHSDRMELGVVERHKWLHALYTQGPFLRFLKENFAEGLELIARLVEFAAARAREFVMGEASHWRARAIAEGLTEAEVHEQLEEVASERLYGWSGGSGNAPYAIQAALMALEQYFYQRLDEGHDVAAEVRAVLSRCESMAFVGLLCDVGKRHPDLFTGPLQSLLSAPELYAWDITRVLRGRTHLMIGVVSEGAWFVELASKFHNLEHRQLDLRNVAIRLMLNNRQGMRDYFDRARSAWSAAVGVDSPHADMARQLDVALNPRNYEVRQDPKHGAVVVNVEALRIADARVGEREAINDQMMLSVLPMRCRTILDERQRLDDAQLAELWGQWTRLRVLARAGPELPNGEVRFGDEYINAIAGGIAVFLSHADWCADGQRLAELSEALRSEVFGRMDAATDVEGDDSISTWSWHCSAAEAGVMLFARHPNVAEWRLVVAEACLSSRYAVAKVLFGRCAEFRSILREDFSRLRRLALEWAYVRDRVDLLRRVPREALGLEDELVERVTEALSAWVEEKLAGFVDATSPGMPEDWKECAEVERFSELDSVHPRWARRRELDFHAVRCAHEWLPRPDGAQDARERAEVVGFWRSAISLVVARPAKDLERREHQYPNEDERWVLERVGAALLQLRPDEQPDLLWQPVLDLHGEGHDWPEVLARAVHRQALCAEKTPASYASLVRSFLNRAFTDVDGERRWSWHDNVWDAIIGVDSYSRALWEPRHVVLVHELEDVFLQWMDRVPRYGRRLAGFASWVARRAASPLRFKALQWMRTLVRADGEAAMHDADDAEDAIASLLNAVWTQEEAKLRGDEGAFDAFRSLLDWLGSRQNQLGLELLGRLGSLT